MDMPAIVEDSPHRLTGAQLGQAISLLSAQINAANHRLLVSRYEPVAEPGLEGLLEWESEEVAPACLSSEAADGASGEAANGDAAPPALDAEAMRELARELYSFQDKDGMWIIRAKLSPEQGQLIMQALQPVARPLEEERQEVADCAGPESTARNCGS